MGRSADLSCERRPEQLPQGSQNSEDQFRDNRPQDRTACTTRRVPSFCAPHRWCLRDTRGQHDSRSRPGHRAGDIRYCAPDAGCFGRNPGPGPSRDNRRPWHLLGVAQAARVPKDKPLPDDRAATDDGIYRYRPAAGRYLDSIPAAGAPGSDRRPAWVFAQLSICFRSVQRNIWPAKSFERIDPLIGEGAYERALGVPSLEGVVGVRTNTSSAVLYAVERGAGIGMLPNYALALGAKLVPIDVGMTHRLDIWLTYHPDLRKSDRHILVIDWLRRIFDARRYRCFDEKFTHPYDLLPLMTGAIRESSAEGFAAANPAVLTVS